MSAIRGLAVNDPIWQEYKAAPNDEGRNDLIVRYLPIVKYHARRIWCRLPKSVEFDDLMSAGVFGLMDAIEKFDLSRGVKFETYCAPRIRGSILDELKRIDWIPGRLRKKARKLQEARAQLYSMLSREPSDEELALHLNLSIEKFYELLRETEFVSVSSLDQKRFETDSEKEVREVDLLKDRKQESPDARIALWDDVSWCLRGLSTKERLVLVFYYLNSMTMKETGEVLDLGESRISQMHTAIRQRIQRRAQNSRSFWIANGFYYG